MKKIIYVFVFLYLFCTLTATALAQPVPEYRLGPGDVLDVTVWGYDEFRPNNNNTLGVPVRPDGKISFPLAGEIRAEGMTPGELAEALATKLGEYIAYPRVTVNVLKFRTIRVYVMGEVTKPGLYELDLHHNVLDAIGAAGGYTKDTAKKKVFIVRADSYDKPIRVNLFDILQKGDMSQNYQLGYGDVVYLTKNDRIDMARDILPFISGAYYLTHM